MCGQLCQGGGHRDPHVEHRDICARKVTREGILEGVLASDDFLSLVTRTPLREFTVGRADHSFVLAWQQYHQVPWYGADLYLASTDGVSLRATPQLVATEVGFNMSMSAGPLIEGSVPNRTSSQLHSLEQLFCARPLGSQVTDALFKIT